MKIYYLINENHEITQDGYTKFDDACLEMEKENYSIANGYNGRLYFTDYMQSEEYATKKLAYEQKAKLSDIRRRRESECFPVINRGELWYERLTEEKRQELETWYQAWLDAPETLVIPDLPEWLNT